MKQILKIISFLFCFYGFSFSQITMTLGDVTGEVGNNVTVPLTVTNFNNVGAISLKIQYTTDALQYIELQNAAAGFITNVNNGIITIGWFDLSGSNPLNIGNGKLVDIVFNYIGGDAIISFIEGECEIANGAGQPQPVTYNNGSVTGGNPPAISPPTPLTPANGSTNQSVTPTLDWSDVDGAVSYSLLLATNQSFSNILIDQNGIVNSEYNVPGGVLSENTLYYWKVNATDGVETSNWSSAFTFTTEGGVPPSDDISMSIQNVEAQLNSEVQVPMNVTLFNNIGAITLRIQFDNNVMNFVRVDNSPISFIANANNGILSLGWFDASSTNPLNLGDGKLCDLVFNYTSGATNVSFLTNQCEITDDNGQVLTVLYFNGQVVEGPPIPTAPTLTSPNNGATNVTLTPDLSWSSVDIADSYGIQLSSNQNFTTLLVDETGLTSTTYSISPGLLNYGATYHWRVNATNENGTSAWSNVFNFSTLAGPLDPPQLVAPVDDAIVETLTPNLSWMSVEDATYYAVQLASDEAFSNLLVDESNVSANQFAIGTGVLVNNSENFWRVKAFSTNNSSDWSAISSFRSFASPLSAPMLNSPANGSTGNDPDLLLDWNDVNDASSYGLQVASDVNFTSVVIQESDLGNSSYSVPEGLLNYLTKYYWRVNAKDNFRTGAWSDTWNYTTTFEPLSAPSLIAPADGATDQILTLTLDWNDVDNSSSYHLQVAADENFSDLVIDAGNLQKSDYSVPDGVLAELTTYYWHVSASNVNTTSNWSSAWLFATSFGLSVDRYLSGIPTSYNLLQNYPNPFNPATKIRYSIPERADVKISIINILGQTIYEVYESNQSAGYYELNWDASQFTTGTYIYKFTSKGESGKEYFSVKKMLLTK